MKLQDDDFSLFGLPPRFALERSELDGRWKQLQREAHPDRFAALAEAHSACPSSKQGGNLGQVGPGQTVPEFEAALASLPVGVVAAQPVESRYGLHVVRVDRRIEGRDLPFDLVRERIADYLEEAVQRRALHQYVSILAGRARLSGVEFGAANGPLVQ